MNTAEELNITIRFWRAYDRLKENRIVRNDTDFCQKHSIDRSNFYRTRRMGWPASLTLIYILVNHYNVNPDYLILGRGMILRPHKDLKRYRAYVRIYLCDN